MIDKVRASVGDSVRLSVHSAFDDVKTACVRGGIEFLKGVRGEPTLTREGWQAIVTFLPSKAAMASALSENGDDLPGVEAIDFERDDALRRFEAVQASLTTKNT